MRRSGVLAFLLLTLAACTDRGPLLPRDLPPPPGAAPVAALRCTVTLGGAARLACEAPEPSTGAAAGNVIVGGQHLFVQLTSSGASFAADTFSVDVTVRSLLAQPLGTADGTTPSGVHVFFHTLPVAAPSGTVTVANADGVGMFTAAAQPYFTYPQVIQPGAVSAPRTWKFHVGPGAASFSFTVYVATEIPDPNGLFRWVRLDGGGSEAGTPGSSRTLAVRGLNRRGEGVPGVPVAWSVVTGGGSLSAAATQTDASGRAEVAWTLGAGEGTHRVDAAGPGLAQSFLAPIPDAEGRLNVTPALQGGGAVSAEIGPAGGALQTTGADGTLYVLTVPAGALQDPETLTLTPIASLPDLPLPGGMAAGVQLAPSGLTFTLPVNLTMVVPEGTPTTDLVGFGYAGTGEGLHLQPADVAGRAVTLYLSHFSGAGGGDGGGGIPDPLRPAGQIASEAMAMAALAILDFEARITGRGASYRTAVHGVLLSWWLNGVRPDLQHATTNDGALNDAAAQYAKWKVMVQRYAADLTAQEAEGKQLLVAGFRNAILKAGDRCTATKSLAEAARMVRLAEKSMALGLADEDPALSDAEVRLVLCVEAKVAPPPAPPSLQPNVEAQVPFVPSISLNNRYQERYQPGGGALRSRGGDARRSASAAETDVEAPLHVTVTRQGAVETAVMNVTITAGDTVHVPVTPTADSVSLNVRACLRAPGETRLDDVCQVVVQHYGAREPRLVFWDPGDGPAEAGGLYTMRPGATRSRIATGSFAYPRWSPDRDRLAMTPYEHGGDLIIKRYDGTTLVTVAGSYALPVWSPDGSRIAVQPSLFSGRLVTLAADGSDQQSVPIGPPVWRLLDWGPHGRILYTSQEPDGLGLVSLDPNTGDWYHLVSPNRTFYAFTAQYSRDAARIVATGVYYESTEAGESSIFRMNADGSGRVKLVGYLDPEISWAFPTWSPDGSSIAYTRVRQVDASGRQVFEIRVTGASGGEGTMITTGRYPSWR